MVSQAPLAAGALIMVFISPPHCLHAILYASTPIKSDAPRIGTL